MPREFECDVRVRYADTDQMRVVHHANYLAYMEEARTILFEDLGSSYAAFERQGLGLAVRRVEIRYRAPARYGETLRVRTRLESLRKASLTLAYEILGPGAGSGTERPPGSPEASETARELLALGSTELACVDLASLRPVALPEDFVARFAPLLVPSSESTSDGRSADRDGTGPG